MDPALFTDPALTIARTLAAGMLAQTVACGFAVAVILFEGGMNLNLGRLRREASTATVA